MKSLLLQSPGTQLRRQLTPNQDLEQEIDSALFEYSVVSGQVQNHANKLKLKSVMFDTLNFNRSCDWAPEYANVLLVKTAADYLRIMALRAERYQEMGYDQIYGSVIPGLDFDQHDRHSLILFCRYNGRVVATERIIVKQHDSLLPAEKIVDADQGLSHIRESVQSRQQTYAEKSRLIIAADATVPGLFFKKLFASTFYLALQQQIGNYIALTTSKEYHKNYKRFGMVAEKTGHFFVELEEPDVVLSWDLNTQVSAFFERAILSQSRVDSRAVA